MRQKQQRWQDGQRQDGQQDSHITNEDSHITNTSELESLRHEVTRLRKTLLKHGHAQELFQGRVEGAMDRLLKELPQDLRTDHVKHDLPQSQAVGSLNAAQLRSLVEMGQAVGTLKGLATGGSSALTQDEDSPRSLREGLDLLGIRVSNLQHSFGLIPIPTLGRPFDDHLHRAHGVCHRGDLPDGRVVEELLPGFLLEGEVVRPALVIVNRRPVREP